MSISYPALQWNWIPSPLSYLPSDTVQQLEFAKDVYLVTIGALTWDIFVTLPDDITLFKSGFRPILSAYFLSRICALGYIIQLIVVNIYPVSHCIAIGYATTICWVVASASGSTLLFQRVRTVYSNSKTFQWAFFILLISNIGLCLVVPLASRFKELPITRYCADRGFRGYAVAALISRVIYSFSVFLAICLRVVTMKGVSGEPLSWRTFLSSSRMVRAIFRSGQQYYLISVCFNMLVVVLNIVPSHSVPTAYKILWTAPDIAFSTSMACRVFRNLKITTDKIDSAMSELMSSAGNVNTGTAKHRQSLGFAGFGTASEVGSGFGLGPGLGVGMGPMGQSRASLSMISLRERLNSNASEVNLPPVPPLPASHTYAAHTPTHVHGHGHLRSLSATSLSRLRGEDQGERYSILKVKPIGDGAINGVSSASRTLDS